MTFSAQYQLTFEEYKDAMKGISEQVQANRKSNKPGSQPRPIVWLIVLVVMMVLLIALKLHQNPTPPPANPSPTPPTDPFSQAQNIFFDALPFLIFFALVWFFFYRQLRGHHQKAFDETPFLHRMRTIQIDDDGITQTEATSQSRHSWAHYIHFSETQNLFLLFISPTSAEPLPKRIFPDQPTLDAFRSLLQHNINPTASAFPVIPLPQST